MQLLDSCPLPQAQFASLSILVQLNLNDDDGEDDQAASTYGDNYHQPPKIVSNVSCDQIESPTSKAASPDDDVAMVQCKTPTGGTKYVPLYPKGTTVYYKTTTAPPSSTSLSTKVKIPATIMDVHMDDLLEPYYTIKLNDGREKQTDNDHLRLDMAPTEEETEEGDDGCFADGGEGDISGGPPRAAQTHHARKKLQHAVVEESLTVVSPMTLLPGGACNRSMESLHRHLMEEFGMRDDFRGIGVGGGSVDGGDSAKENMDGNNEDEGDGPNEDDDANTRRSSKVRFHDGTKEGRDDAATDVNNGPSRSMNEPLDPPFGASQLPVEVYHPPSHHLNCSLGLTMFYAAVHVEDISKLSTPSKNDDDDNDAASLKLLNNCTSVLLPTGVSLTSLIDNSSLGEEAKTSKGRKSRKQGGIVLLAVGTTGPAYDLYGASSVFANLPERLCECMSTLAGVDTTTAIAAKSKRQDPSYFKRLYMALLATIIDDEDGLMRDHDEVIPPVEQQQSKMVANQSSTATGSPASPRKKLFTFSFGKRGAKSKGRAGEYESGESISGGDAFEGGGAAARDDDGVSSGVDNAEIVRRMAQKMELISLVEDDMPLPKYSHASTSPSKSPRNRSKGGLTSARFGRLSMPSDLSGFEYRPPPHSQQNRSVQHGGWSISGGTASTSVMGASTSDDVSVLTGAEETVATNSSRYTVGSSSSSSLVPTLSKSKRDSTKGSSRSRFFQRKKKKSASGSPPAQIGDKPPLFPQRQSPQQQQPVYDPFSVDDDEVQEEHGNEEELNVKTPTQAVAAATAPEEKEEAESMTPDQKSPVEPTQAVAAEAPKEEVGSTAESMTPDQKSPVEPQPTPPPPPPQDTVTSPVSGEAAQELAAMRREAGKIATRSSRTISYSYSEDNSEGVATEEPGGGAESLAQSPTSIATESATDASSAPKVEASSVEEPPGLKEPPEVKEPNEPPGNYRHMPSFVSEPPGSKEPPEVEEPTTTRHLDVGLALNEDLTCEYKNSKLSTHSVEGTVQVRIKTREEGQQSPPPLCLVFQDNSGHVRALQENKKFVENVTNEIGGDDAANREFKYTIRVPREGEYFPVVRYKCGNSLRPVPIRVQSRVRTQGKFCRIALQISSNPQNPADLVHLTMIMSVPAGIRGDTLQTNPPGGVWNESKRVVLWCVSELGGGEKFQLQSIFEIEEEMLAQSRSEGSEDLAQKLDFPVLARCQCPGLLSDVALDIEDTPAEMFQVKVTKNVVKRFRVSHKESNR